MENNKNPNIRFKGFTDPWEQRKFEDVTFLSGEKNKNNLPFESYSVTNENGFVPQNEQFENGGTMATADKRMYYIVSKNSFAYNPARINVGSIGYYDGSENVIVSSLYEVFKTSEDIDDRYLWNWFKSNNFKKLIEQYQEGGVRLYFYYDKLCMCYLPTPSIQEQVKIGRYFDNLDNLITLHQRKYNKLLNVKKSMLEKMFPKNGSNIPEIRFKGFTDPWEQRKLRDEAIEMLAGGDIDKSKIVENGKYPIYANALTNDGIVGYYDDYYRVKAPAVTVTGRGDVGHAQARTVDFTPVVRLLTIRSEHDAYFLENAINNHSVIVESTGVPQLTVPQLENYMIQFPKTIEEETKIGEYFRNLDNLITLHQRELEKLQNIKKSMLEKMFV